MDEKSVYDDRYFAALSPSKNIRTTGRVYLGGKGKAPPPQCFAPVTVRSVRSSRVKKPVKNKPEVSQNQDVYLCLINP